MKEIRIAILSFIIFLLVIISFYAGFKYHKSLMVKQAVQVIGIGDEGYRQVWEGKQK